jgi:orotate phosphoribosyltransferase
MTDSEVLESFEKTGALLKGHFQLSSGLHSPQYMQCALVLARPNHAAALGAALAQKLPEKPDLVVSPAMGGLIIGHEVARALGVRAYFSERENGVMTLRRGFSLSPGERVVVVEDVVTTGKSSQEVIDVISASGARPIAVVSIVDRTSSKISLSVPRFSLLKLDIPSYPSDNCPLCHDHAPIVKPGSRTLKK